MNNLRAWIVFGVVLVMPALAIPRLNQWLNANLRLPSRASSYRERLQAVHHAGAEARQKEMISLTHRLRRLGAQQLTLEPCTEKGFRFHCGVRVTAAKQLDHFEAYHREPEQAMNLVLDAIVQAQALATRKRAQTTWR